MAVKVKPEALVVGAPPTAQEVHSGMHRALGNPTFRIDLSSIRVPPEAYELVADCLRQGAIGQSAYVREFERAVAEFVGARHCIATSSGTLADAILLGALKAKYPLVSRVLVPALTFIAQPNAVRHAGLQVEFVDVTEDWALDLGQLRKVHRSEVVFITHLMGRVARIEAMPAGALFVEDACEAFGATYGGQHAGTFGLGGAYSFFVSHTVTTGEGGAIVTNDDELADLCRRVRSQGRASESDPLHKFDFPLRGFNGRLSGLAAAFGVAVMRNARQYVGERRAVFAQLNARLDGRFRERPGECAVPHGYPVGFQSEALRDRALRNLIAAGIECRKFFSSVPTEGAYHNHTQRRFPVAEHISRTHLYVPCHQNLSTDDVEWIAACVLAQEGLC